MDFVLGPDDAIEYVFDEHKDRDKPPVMLLRNFTMDEHREYIDVVKKATPTVHSGKQTKPAELDGLSFQSDVLKLGWVGWRNVPNGEGQDVTFESGDDGRPTDVQINRLRVNHRAELLSAIGNQSSDLSEEQRKNLGLPSSSTPDESTETAPDA